jgi:hypothetical protein
MKRISPETIGKLAKHKVFQDFIKLGADAQLQSCEKEFEKFAKDWSELKEGLDKQEDMLLQAKRETAREIINTYDDMIENMGLDQDNFKRSDWQAVQALKSRYLKEA